MALSPAQLVILQTELTSDPLAVGYPGMPDGAVADSLNAQTRPGILDSLSSLEIQKIIAGAGEFGGLNATKKNQLISFLASETIDSSDGGYGQLVLTEIFSAGPTLTALATARSTMISRAKELKLSHISHVDVAAARGRP